MAFVKKIIFVVSFLFCAEIISEPAGAAFIAMAIAPQALVYMAACIDEKHAREVKRLEQELASLKERNAELESIVNDGARSYLNAFSDQDPVVNMLFLFRRRLKLFNQSVNARVPCGLMDIEEERLCGND